MLWPLSFSTVQTCVGGFSTLTPERHKLLIKTQSGKTLENLIHKGIHLFSRELQDY